MRRARSYGATKRTVADRTAAMTLLLAGCTEARLAAMTADELAGQCGVEVKVAEYHLTIAKQRRGVAA